MKRNAASSQTRRARLAGSDRSTRRPLVPNPEFIEGSKGATRVRRTRTDMPPDAEDFVLDSLDAQVRAEEARVDVESESRQAALTIRLPRPLLVWLRTQAARRGVTPSKLIGLALAQYLIPRRGRTAGR